MEKKDDKLLEVLRELKKEEIEEQKSPDIVKNNMSVIICKECHQKIDANSKQCPNCGFKIKQEIKEQKSPDIGKKKPSKFKKIFKNFLNKISIIIGIVIIIIGIVFIYLSIDKSQVYAKTSISTYGADYYTDMSRTARYISIATSETFYLIERCFGISLIITGTFYIIHTLRKMKEINTRT